MRSSPDGTKTLDCSGRRPRNELSPLPPFLTSTPTLAARALRDLRFNRHLKGHGPAPKASTARAESALGLAIDPAEQMSSSRSFTRSQARSLLSIARLKIARSRIDSAISRRTRIDHTCLGSRGFFWPTSSPLFQGRWHRSTGLRAYETLRQPRPQRRSIASE